MVTRTMLTHINLIKSPDNRSQVLQQRLRLRNCSDAHVDICQRCLHSDTTLSGG